MRKQETVFYLHIGLPKTASTYLQEVFFPSLQHLRYRGIPRSDLFEDAAHLQADHRILTSVFDRSATIWTAMGMSILQHVLGSQRDTGHSSDVLVSDEGVGRRSSRPSLFHAHLRNLRRVVLESGFSQLRVLCFFRRQDHWLASHYAQISDRKPKPSQADFERTVRTTIAPAGERYRFGMLLDFDMLREQLWSVCGRDGVLMLPYEYLAEDASSCRDDLRRFLRSGNPVKSEPAWEPTSPEEGRPNVRSAGHGTWKLRPRRNRLAIPLRPRRVCRFLGLPVEVPLAPGDWKRPGEIELTEMISSEVLTTYASSNKSLARHLDLDLRSYGYF